MKFEQNSIIRVIRYFEHFGKNMVEKVFKPFWKTFLWHKQLCDAKVPIEKKKQKNIADSISFNVNGTFTSRCCLFNYVTYPVYSNVETSV